jgi:antitoxin HigA-1
MSLRHPSIEPAHPGAIVAETIEALAVSKSELARRLGITRAALYNVIAGRSAMSADLAVRIEATTGTSAGLLLRMQTDHDLWKARRSFAARRSRRGQPGPRGPQSVATRRVAKRARAS